LGVIPIAMSYQSRATCCDYHVTDSISPFLIVLFFKVLSLSEWQSGAVVMQGVLERNSLSIMLIGWCTSTSSLAEDGAQVLFFFPAAPQLVVALGTGGEGVQMERRWMMSLACSGLGGLQSYPYPTQSLHLCWPLW
jgi:hypothetical protein